MKKQNALRGVCGFVFLSLSCALLAPAQTSFWWTNNASGVWNGSANWSNENGTVLAPANGGNVDYGITFQNTSAVITTNNSATPRFFLNQLAFGAGAGVVTIFAGNGTNITFTNSTAGALPQFIKSSANNVTNNIAFVLATNTAFIGTGAGTVLVNSNVSGTGGLLMGGSYTLVLASSNTYYGTTTITNGTLKVGNYRALGTNRTVTVSGAGTLDLNNVDLRTNYAHYVTISGAGAGGIGAIVNNSGGGLVNLGLDRVTLAGDATIGGSARWGIQSSLDLAGYRLTKVGAAQISINSGNLTAGDIDINAGMISFEGTGLIVTGVVGATTLNTGGTLMLYNTLSNNITRPIVANGGTLNLGTGGAGAGAVNSPITLQSNLVVNSGANYILNGDITESGGAYALNKVGAYGMTLNGQNTFSGGLMVSGGVVTVSISENLGGYTGPLTLANNSTLQIAGSALHNLGEHPLVNASGFYGGMDVASPYNTFVVSSNLSGSGKMTKSGLGTLVLLGTSTYTGGTLNNAGLLRIAGGDNSLAGGAVTNAGGTLDLLGNTHTATNAIVLTGGTIQNGTLVSVNSNFDARAGVIAADLQGAVALNKTTTGTLTLLGNNTYSGGTLLTTGTLAIVRDANIGTLTLAGGSLQLLGYGVDLGAHGIDWNALPSGSAFDVANTGLVYVVPGVIGGGSVLAKAGTGTLVLTNDNTYSGPTLLTAGTLQVGAGGTSGTLGAGVVTNTSGAGSLVFSRSDAQTVTNAIAGPGGLYVKNGTLTFSNNAVSLGVGANGSWVGNSPTDVAVLIAAGNAVVTGTANNAAGGLLVAKDGRGYVIIKDNAYVAQRLGVGGTANSAGAIYQLGGTLVTLGGAGYDAGVGGYYNGGTYGAYGYYGLYNGLSTNSNYYQVGGYGVGVLDILGGSLVQNGQPFEISRNGTGVVYFAGNSTFNSAQNIRVGSSSGSAGGLAVMTVADNATVNAGTLEMGVSSQRYATLNLLGGVLQVAQITQNNAATLALVNFDGGTLRVTASGTMFNTGANAPDAVTIYDGGAQLDSSNFNITVSQNLLGADGNGVSGITLGGALSGYVGAPYVAISGGGGTGATAIAQFNYLTGSVTNILITSAGYGYTSAPDVMLIGGGRTNLYLGSASIAANAPGALTKLGTGVMQLTGTNTYTGGTLVNEGTLAFASTNAMGTGLVTVNTGGALAMTGAYANAAAWLTSGKMATNSAGAIALGAVDAGINLDFTSAAGGVYSNLYVGAMQNVLVGDLTFYNNDYRLGGGAGALALTNGLSGNTLTIGAGSPGGAVMINGPVSFTGGITVNSNATLSLNTATASALTLNGMLEVRGYTLTDLPALNPLMGGESGFDINNKAQTFTVSTNLTVSGNFNKQGRGTLVLSGSNNIAGNVVVGVGALNLQNSYAVAGAGGNLIVSNGAAVELQGGIQTEASDLLILNGTGVANDGALRNVANDNNWRGPIALGSATRINSDAGTLTLSGGLTNGANVLTVGGSGDILISGSILGGSGNLIKDGSGTLTLTTSNTSTGATFVNGGTLVVDFSAAGAPLTNILNYGSATTLNLNMGNGTFKMVSSGSQINTQSFNSMVLDSTSGTLAGNATVIATNTGSGASVLVFTNNFTRATGGGVVNLELPGGSGGIRATWVGSTNAAGTMSSYVTVGGRDWAALSANSYIVPFSSYTNVPAGGAILTGTNGLMGNVRLVDGGAGNITLGSSTTTVQNISATNTALVTVDVAGANLLRLSGVSGAAGGLLLAPGSGGLTIGTAVNNGNLTAGWITNNAGSDLVVFQNSANDLTINSAIINNGSGAAALTIAGTGTGAVNLNGTNVFTGGLFVHSGTVNLSNTNKLTGAVTLRGGTTTFTTTSSNSLGAVTVAGNGTLDISGPTTLGGNNMSVGATLNDRAVVTINSNLTANSVRIGTASGANGAVIQNSGLVLINTNTGSTDILSLGQNSGYGYYQMNGGTLLAGQFGAGGGGGSGNVGVYDQFGGTTMVTAANGWLLAGGWTANSRGVINVYDGLLSGPPGQPISLAIANNSGCYGMLNMLGANAVLIATNNANGINIFGNANSSNAVFNLNAGTVVASRVYQSAAGSAQFNFNGGTLMALHDSTNANYFSLNAGGGAYIYSGGAIIDTTNAIITIAQNLQGVTGFGVTNMALASGGAGYIGAPLVLITGGSGTGMTAVAQVDLVAGTVTNLLITSAGTGYLPTDALSVQLLGGGYTTTAERGVPTFAVNANTGGLTVNGAGTLTLTGTNSYAGLTTINGATLVLQPAVTATNSIGGLAGAGTLQHYGTGMTILNGDSSGFTGSATISTGVMQFATLASVPTAATGGLLVNNAGAAAFDFGGGNVQYALTNLNTLSSGSVLVTPNSASEALNFNTTGLGSMRLGATGTQLYNLANHTPAVANMWRLGGGSGTLVITNGLSAGDALDIGGGSGAVRAGGSYSLSSLTISNGVTFDIAGNNQTINVLTGEGGSILNTNAMATLTVGDASDSTFGGSITGAVGLTKVGAGTLTLTNSSTYSGATIISAGTIKLQGSGLNAAGLTEAWTNLQSAWLPNTLTNITTALYPRYAETNTPSGIRGQTPIWPASFPSNATVGYVGYLYNNSGSNVTWTFAGNIDDDSRLVIDGITYLSTSGNRTITTNVVLTPGAHSIDYRLANGTGTAGSYGIFGSTGTGLGLGYDPLGRNSSIYANYQMPIDPGNGTFFTTGLGVLPTLSPMYIASGATLDLNSSTQNVAFLSDYSGGGGTVTNYSGAAAQLIIASYAGSNTSFSGNIGDAGGASSLGLTVLGAGVQALSGNNTYSGGTLIMSGGKLQIDNTNAIPQSGWVTIVSNGTLAAGSLVPINDLLRIGRITNSSAGSVALTVDSSEAVDFTLGGGYSNLYLGAVGDVNFTGSLTPANGTLRLGGGGGTLNYNSALTSGQLQIGGGAGTVVLGNIGNSYTGTIINAGTLRVDNDLKLGSIVAGTTNILFTGAGTLQAGGNVALDASRVIAIASNQTGNVDGNGYTLTINGPIIGTNATLAKIGSGTVVLAGTNTLNTLSVRNGTLAFSGPSSTNGVLGNLIVGYDAGDRGVLVVNTNVTAWRVQVGANAFASGAIYQNGGVFNQTAGANQMDFALGNHSSNSYGYYKLTAGTLISAEIEVGAAGITNSGGNGVFEMYGGTVSNTGYFLIGRNSTSGQNVGGAVNVFGGYLNHQAAANAFGMGWNSRDSIFSMLNVFGDATINLGNKQLFMNNGNNAGNFAYLNLNGGTTIVGNVQASNTAVQIVGFNGGVLKATNGTSWSGTFLRNMTAAYVYDGGAIVDDSGQNITLDQSLLAPIGYGVTGIAVTNGGTGYIGAPLVRIMGGSGTGATAIAQVDFATGLLTNILITSAGSGYLPGDVLSVQMMGGGMLTTAQVGAVSFGVNASAGGYTKLGGGLQTLGGSNTYNGPTLVSAGGLQIGNGGINGSLANPNVVFSNASSLLAFNRSDWVTNSLAVEAVAGSIAAIAQNGAGMLVLTNTTLNFRQAAISNGTVWFAAGAVPTNNGANSIIMARGGGIAVGGAYGTVNGWLASGLITNNAASGTLALLSGANSEDISWGTYSNLALGAAPGQVATFAGSLTPAGGTTNYLVGGGGGTLQIARPNTFVDPNAATNRSLFVGVGGPLTVVEVLGPQGYSGGTVISNALLQVSADNNLGYGNLTLNGRATLQITNAPAFSTLKTLTINTSAADVTNSIGSGSTGTFFNAITMSGGNNLIKWGAGTMIISNAALQAASGAGRIAVEQGTLIVDSGAQINTLNSYHIIGYNSGSSGTELIRGTGMVTLGGQRLILGDQGGSTGTLTLQDQAYMYTTNDMYLGNGGTGTLTLNGGTFTVSNIIFGVNTASMGTLNLNANGRLVVMGTVMGRSASTNQVALNFNGGTLVALNNLAITNGFRVATVNNTSYLDTSNNTVTVGQAFTGSGTLVKLGSGTLVITGSSNTFSAINVNSGMAQFAGTNGMTPGRRLVIGAGGAAGYTNNGVLDQNFLLRVASNSVGVVALTVSNNTAGLDFRGAALTNVSLGAFGAASYTNSGALTNFGNTYRLGGGGGTLVITSNIQPGPGTNLVAFGNGGVGTLILTGVNTWSASTNFGGLVRYGSANSMGTNVWVTTGGAVANNGALDTSLFARLNTASDGAFALVANNAAGAIDLSTFPSLSLGAAGGSWTNDGALTPYGTTYRLGGGGGTLVITNSTTLTGAGYDLVAFGGNNYGMLVLTGANTYDGGTYIGPLGTAVVATASLGTGNVTNNGMLVFGLNSGTFTNTILGTGTLVQNAGTLVFAGANLSTGDTIVQQGGTLYLSNTSGTAISGNLTLARLANNAINVRTLAPNQLSSNSILTLYQSSTNAQDIRFSLMGNSQVIGGLSGVNVKAGNLIVEAANDGAAGMPATLTINVAGGTNFYYGGPTAYLRDAAGGAGSLLSVIKNGAGMQTFGGAQITYTGPTTVNAGILALSNTTGFASPVTVNGGQLLLATPGVMTKSIITNNVNDGLGFSGGNAFTIGGLAGSGDISLISQTGGGVALTLGNNNVSSLYSGTLSDGGPGNYFQGSVIKTGSGAITLMGANTYYGRTTVGGTGYLVIGNNLALGNTNGDTVVTSGAHLQLTNGVTIADETVFIAGGGTDFSGALQTAANSTGTWNGPVFLNDASANNPRVGTQTNGLLTISGPITSLGASTNFYVSAGTGAGGAGVVVISGTNNTYSGITGVIRGTLKLGANDALPTSTILDLHPAAATEPSRFDLAGFNQTVRQLKDTDYTGSRLITNSAAGASVLTVNQDVNTSYLGLIAGDVGIVKTGSGALTFSNAANTYLGQTIVAGGVLYANNKDSLGSPSAGTVVSNGAALRFWYSNMTNAEPLTLSGEGVGTSASTYGALGLRQNTGVFKLQGAITLAGGAAINTYNAGLTTVTVDQGIGGTGDLTLSAGASANGGATYILLGQASYDGNTYLKTISPNFNGITVQLGTNNALPVTTVLNMQAENSTANKARLQLNGFDQTLAGLIGTNTVAGFNTNSVINGSATAATLTLNNAANFTFDGQLGGPGANENNFTLVKTGGGIQTLSPAYGASTFTGGTIISNGTLKLGVNNALPITGTVYADTAGTLDLAGLSQQLGSLSSYKGTVTSSSPGGQLLVVAGPSTVMGTLTGPGSLTLTGGGTMTLTGTNSFSLGTLVSNATYLVNGLHNGGVITVISNGLVGGSGPISALYVNNGGTYAPGNSIATQYVGSLTLTNSGVLEMELGAGAQVNDRTIVTNDLTIAGGQIKLNLSTYSLVQGSAYTLVVWGGASGFNPLDSAQWLTINDTGVSNGVLWAEGTVAPIVGGTGSNNFFRINYDDVANGHAITLTSVPEPGTASLLGLVGLAFLVRHLRRRFQKQG